MKNKILLVLIFINFCTEIFSQTNTCFTANPFCSSTLYNFPAAPSGNSPSGPNYGCLSTRPRPIWYYMEISTAGTIDILLQQTTGPNGTGSTRDVDFAMWGPFSSLEAGCNAVMSGNLAPIQCSYSPSYSEDLGLGVSGGYGSGYSTPPAAQVGQVYIVLLTNYAGGSAYISFNQVGGTGSADCSIVEPCSISNLTANIGACGANSANYSVNGTINVSNPPSTGQLIVEDCSGNQSVVASAPFNASSYNYSLSGLIANGSNCNVSAYFTGNSVCSAIISYTAPNCSGCSMTDITTNVGACNSSGNFSLTGSVTFSNPPTSGTLTISTSCGGSQTFNAPFTSPTNYTINNLTANASVCNVTASFSANTNCQTTTSFTSPEFLTSFFDPINLCQGDPAPTFPSMSSQGISGTWNNTNINTNNTGTTSYTFTPSANQCASNGTLTITVNPTETQTDNVSICDTELPYSWNGQTITAGGNGVATHTTQNANGCDVITTLNLTVNPTETQTDNVSICDTELPYSWNGQTISAGGNGVATHTTQNANGCDVITTLNLTVNPTETQTDNVSICDTELPYSWNGQTISAGGNGVATHTTQNANGCDVITTLNLTVYPTETQTDDIEICDNELPYTWNGQTISAGGNGVATHITQNANGCDVITTLNLTVYPTETQTDDIEICDNELPYTWNGQTISAGGNGVATHTTQNANGCDVITTLNLTVNPTETQTDNVSICDTELPYSWNGQTISAGGNGVATHTTQNANGCDVITTLNLTINPTQTQTDDIEICETELPYTWNGQTISAGGNGVATHTTQNANGCDVITTLNLTVNPTQTQTDDIEICETELPYTWNGQTISAGGNGVATHTTQNANGCDVITTLNLTVNPTETQTDDIEICETELPYTWNGQIITAGGNGVATHVTQNANGCDVITTLNLTVYPTETQTDDIEICETELPYTWNGQTISAGGNGVATHTTQNANGCDVITTLNLTVYPTETQTDDIEICDNELPYTWNGQTISAGGNGVATHTTQNANGCDVITTLNLTVNPTETQTDDIEICDNELPYTWNGQTISAGGNGVATHTTQNANGCDVITTLNLTVNPTETQTDDIEICDNELPYTWNDQTISAGGNGVATHTTQNANGCDVITTLNLTVYPTETQTDDIEICDNELPYTWNGQTISAGGNGVATHTTQNANGCDVITTLNLTVYPTETQTDNIVICSNQLPYSWHGQTIAAGGNGVATHTTQNANGCDITTTLNLTVHSTESYTENITICDSDLPYNWNGQIITTGGNAVASHVTQNANGCDVTTYLNVIISPTINQPENISICSNQLPFVWHGQTITAGGTGVATHTTQNANGCDVITTLNLTVNSTETATEDITICANELPFLWNGQVINAGGNGVATHISQNASGCNVTTTLNLTVNPATTTEENVTICESELPYMWNGQTVTEAGYHVAQVSNTNASGCIDRTYLNLTVLSGPAMSYSIDYDLCMPSTVSVTPNSTADGYIYSWYLNDNLVSNSTTPFVFNLPAAGCHDLVLELSAGNGCTYEIQSEEICVDYVPLADFVFSSGNVSTSSDVHVINLSQNATSYTWYTSNGTSSTGTNPVLSFENGNSSSYYVTLYAYSPNGCVDSITRLISIEEEIIFYVPNTFTPDGDEFNHYFGPVISSGIDVYNYGFTIYNRWGERVFETHDVNVMWDGTYNGKMVQDGVYTWKLEFLQRNNDKRHHYTGHVTKIR